MILILDIGNTNIHMGLYHNETMVRVDKWATKNGFDKKFFRDLLCNKDIEGVGIASVIPALNQRLNNYLEKNFGIKPLFVCSTLKMPVKIGYKNLGADRIANIVAGFIRYHQDLMVFAFGTAITGDVVSKNGIHLGGLILPGLETQLWSLNQRTALIKNNPIEVPAKLFGKNTNECVQSGIVNGTKFSIQGLIREIKKRTKKNYKIIATGGGGKKMAHLIPEINKYDRDLTLYGILRLYYYNV